MANEIQKRPIDTLKGILDAPSVQEQFKNALGDNAKAFTASLIDLYSSDKQLQGCKQTAIVAEALRAATLQLPITKSLGFAYVVVFNNSVKNANGTWDKVPTPTFMLGYKGYIQLAMRTGQYKTINADLVYEGELSSVDKLSGAIKFDGKKTSDKVVGYFAYFELLNGFSKTLYMSVEDMATYALHYSPSFKGRNKPTQATLVKNAQENAQSNKVGWEGNFNDMALKTVIRRLLSKYGYLSVEMQGAMAGEIKDTQAMSIRNDDVSENLETKVDMADFEVVDEETGEIKTTDEGEASSDEDDEPNY